MVKLHLRHIYGLCKDQLYHLLSLFSAGISFESLSRRYLDLISTRLPPKVQYPAQLLFIYLAIHVYLFYILCAIVAKVVLDGTKIRGNRLFPTWPGVKEKLTLWVTSIFVFHWLYSVLFGANWSFLTDWMFAIRPQINIKPQVKVVQQTSSSASMSSTVSFSMEEPSASMDVGLEADDDGARQFLRNVATTRRGISNANDLYHSMASDVSSSGSRGSVFSSDEEA